MNDANRFAALRFVLTSVLIVLIAGCTNDAPDSYADLIASRPAPNLDTLAERSRPGQSHEIELEAFPDILKLREVGDASAVPVLEEIIVADAHSGRIHAYAAAQALFCIDTPEAHAIISKFLLTSSYPAQQGIFYTFYWEMREPERSSFIDRYHLKVLSQDLNVELSFISSRTEGAQEIVFTVKASNTSNKAIRISDLQVYQGLVLHFRDDSGSFRQGHQTVEYGMPMPKWLELAPGAIHQFDIIVTVEFGEDMASHTNDVGYDLDKPGRFEVYALVEAGKPTAAQLDYLKFNNLWWGRAVSKPIEVVIGE